MANLREQLPETAGYDVAAHVAALARHGVAFDVVLADKEALQIGELPSGIVSSEPPSLPTGWPATIPPCSVTSWPSSSRPEDAASHACDRQLPLGA